MNTAFRRISIIFPLVFGLLFFPRGAGESVMVVGIPLDFILLAMTLLASRSFTTIHAGVGLTGLATISIQTDLHRFRWGAVSGLLATSST